MGAPGMSRGVRAVLAAAVLSIGGRAVAGPASPPPEAVAHVGAGNRAYEAGDYDKAFKEYQAAYEIFPSPHILYNEAQAQRLGGNCERAVLQYQAYLRTAPANDTYLKMASRHEQECEEALKAKAAAQPATPPPPAPPPPPPTPTAAASATAAPIPTPPTPPPSHVVVPAAPPPAPPPAPGSAWYSDGLGWTLVGSGLAIAAGGGGLLLYAAATAPSANAPLDQYVSQYQRSRNLYMAGWISVGAGGVVALGGVTRMLLVGSSGGERGPEAASPRVSVGLAPFGLALDGRF